MLYQLSYSRSSRNTRLAPPAPFAGPSRVGFHQAIPCRRKCQGKIGAPKSPEREEDGPRTTWGTGAATQDGTTDYADYADVFHARSSGRLAPSRKLPTQRRRGREGSQRAPARPSRLPAANSEMLSLTRASSPPQSSACSAPLGREFPQFQTVGCDSAAPDRSCVSRVSRALLFPSAWAAGALR